MIKGKRARHHFVSISIQLNSFNAFFTYTYETERCSLQFLIKSLKKFIISSLLSINVLWWPQQCELFYQSHISKIDITILISEVVPVCLSVCNTRKWLHDSWLYIHVLITILLITLFIHHVHVKYFILNKCVPTELFHSFEKKNPKKPWKIKVHVNDFKK